MEYDELWPGGPKLYKHEDVLALGTDAVMLFSFSSGHSPRRVLDMGTGSGIIAILTAFANSSSLVTGIELQPHAAAAAASNVKLNSLSDRINIIQGDIRDFRKLGEAGEYDLVLCNPPYFPVKSGKASENEKLAIARDERECTLSDVCAAASYFTKWGGRFAMIHRPERLSDVMREMSTAGLEPKRLRFVQNRTESLPNLILVEGRRGGKSGLSIERPLILTDRNGNDTQEITEIYHRKRR